MEIHKYQEMAKATAIYPASVGLSYTALGLAGEAGEVANKVKKILRDRNGVLTSEDQLAIAKELGDCLWYLAMLATEIQCDLQEIAIANLGKLSARKDKGTLQGSGDDR